MRLGTQYCYIPPIKNAVVAMRKKLKFMLLFLLLFCFDNNCTGMRFAEIVCLGSSVGVTVQE